MKTPKNPTRAKRVQPVARLCWQARSKGEVCLFSNQEDAEFRQSYNESEEAEPTVIGPVLVVDLSPDNIARLSKKLGRAANQWLSGDIPAGKQTLEQVVLAALGLTPPTKPQSKKAGGV